MGPAFEATSESGAAAPTFLSRLQTRLFMCGNKRSYKRRDGFDVHTDRLYSCEFTGCAAAEMRDSFVGEELPPV